ncbi:hypothetical protein C8F01DRAFT_1236108 [Mycena amicta]|nr:hypothetical protein C8F01DRAFT_1236108 [Mycena amicta]
MSSLGAYQTKEPPNISRIFHFHYVALGSRASANLLRFATSHRTEHAADAAGFSAESQIAVLANCVYGLVPDLFWVEIEWRTRAESFFAAQLRGPELAGYTSSDHRARSVGVRQLGNLAEPTLMLTDAAPPSKGRAQRMLLLLHDEDEGGAMFSESLRNGQ